MQTLHFLAGNYGLRKICIPAASHLAANFSSESYSASEMYSQHFTCSFLSCCSLIKKKKKKVKFVFSSKFYTQYPITTKLSVCLKFLQIFSRGALFHHAAYAPPLLGQHLHQWRYRCLSGLLVVPILSGVSAGEPAGHPGSATSYCWWRVSLSAWTSGHFTRVHVDIAWY